MSKACPSACSTAAAARGRPGVPGSTRPCVTILLPYGNASTSLAITLETLLSQSFTDWEALLIDTGARDDSAEVAAEYAALDRRFRLLRVPQGRDIRNGFAAARDLGMRHARGRLLAFGDPGALWMPEKLALLVAAFDDITLDGCYASGAHVATARPGAPLPASDLPPHPRPLPPEDLTIARLLADNPVDRLSNLVLRTEVALACGGFDSRLTHGDELEWLIRLVGQGNRLAPLDRALVLYPRGHVAPGAAGEQAPDLAAICAGRLAALVSAARYGRAASARDEAVHLRRLARRALRQGAPRRQALALALRGLLTSPAGWFADRRGGALVLTSALAYLLLPQGLSRNLFAN
ncbi:glycosyltransferase family 2 protein [Pseudooceanicola sp. 200-1SW]|uniref:glycosyltransferase family 2 protein n=1 Tax=Pseudooceanicola sp. 200-1SW TaxID=3425949 RepID=UPI003D7F3E83